MVEVLISTRGQRKWVLVKKELWVVDQKKQKINIAKDYSFSFNKVDNIRS